MVGHLARRGYQILRIAPVASAEEFFQRVGDTLPSAAASAPIKAVPPPGPPRPPRYLFVKGGGLTKLRYAATGFLHVRRED